VPFRVRDAFDAEITTIAPVRAVVRDRMGASEVEAAAHAAGTRAYIRVADDADGISHGEFYVWLNGERTVVRLDEHREWYARDPAVEQRTRGEVQFCDEDGPAFSEPLDNTISRVQAMTALARWLATGEKLPELAWE
jgi:Immunity protein Imm1